jgi:hypothetical protein
MLEPGFVVTSPRGTVVEILENGGTWVTGPPVAAQKLLATVLAAVAGARGIRPIVPPGI